jgi:SPASM domain peptide maturase of grasp-with-spasm system
MSNSYYALTSYFKNSSIGEILKMLDGEDSRFQFYRFLTFLLDEHIACLVNDISVFPAIPVCWDSPFEISTAIIDIRNKWDFLEKAFRELFELRCEFLQLRFYSEADRGLIKQVVSLVKGRCFKDVEFLIKYSGRATSHQFLAKLCESQRNVRFLVHSAPVKAISFSDNSVRYTGQQITSCANCGTINAYTLRIPSIQGYMENKLFNSCLNRKISIDEDGFIKNCPSMKKNYGHIADTSMVTVARKQSFKNVGGINKDITDTCKDCEFRYLCSDCRAYTKNNSLTGKPSKCKYDPYEGKWK